MPKSLMLGLAIFAGIAAAQEPIRVVATTPDLKSLVEVVGGERVDVSSLAAPAEDPRALRVAPAALRGAALLVRAGVDFEPWLAEMKSPKGLRVLDASQGVRLLPGHSRYWLDPHNAQPITASILAALIRLSPQDEARFQANRDAFLSLLADKIFRWETRLAPLRGTKAVALHDDWAYFGERFGLHIRTAAEAARRGETDFQLVIADPRSDPARVARLAEKTGARVVTLLPSGDDYIGLFADNVRRLARK
jgi:ABC-type Zn uptake system ZnuABC Zn-binding protein ZnuA